MHLCDWFQLRCSSSDKRFVTNRNIKNIFKPEAVLQNHETTHANKKSVTQMIFFDEGYLNLEQLFIDSVQFIQRLELNIQAEKYAVIRNTFVFVLHGPANGISNYLFV